MWKHALNKWSSLFKPLKRKKGVKIRAPHKVICNKSVLHFKLKQHFCVTGVEHTLPVSPTLSLHLPPADSAAENSDCTVVRQRAWLGLRYNRNLFPQKERERDWEGEEAPFIYTITFLPPLSAREKTVGKQLGQPGPGITHLTCPPDEWQPWFL